MQVDLSNNLKVSTTNIKELANSDVSTYTKEKPENKFGTVLEKEKQNLSSKETKEVDNKEIVTSKTEETDLKDTSSPVEDTVEVKVDGANEKSAIETAIKLDEDIKDLSKDEILSYLAAVVELINKMTPSQMNTESQTVNADGNTIDSEITNIQIDNLIINDTVADELILTKSLNMSVFNNGTENSMDQEEAVNVINNLLSILETGDDNELLNKESLNTIQGLLNELGVKIDEEVGTKDIKINDILKELVKNSKVEVNTLVETKTSKENIQNNIVDKGLVSKEETPIAKNVDVNINKSVNEVNYVKENLTDSGKDSNQNSNSTLNKEISKEEKLLSSILDDGDEKVDNKFSLIVDRLGTKTTTQINVEPTIINKESISVDIVKNVKLMVTNSIKEMTVKITPGQLGEITIKLTEEAGVMKANIKASSKETYNLLTQQLGDIKKHLGEQNIKIQEVNVSIYEEDATFYKDGQFSSNSYQDGNNNGQSNGTVFNGEFTEEELKTNNELNEESNMLNMLA
jgi:flagellar hook-length control protein FliK